MIAQTFGTLISERAATSIDGKHPGDPALAKMFGLGTPVKSGVRVDDDSVLGIPAVLRGVNIISNALMKVRPIIYKRVPGEHEDDRQRDRSHSSWKFVTRRASELMSAGYFRKTLTAWSIYRGNALGYLVRDGAGRIVDSIPLLPDRSGLAVFRSGQQLNEDVAPQEGDVVRYWTTVGGEVRKFKPEDVIHIKGISRNGYWGIDIVDALAETFGLAIAARDFSASFFGQGATASGIIFMPSGIKPDQQEDFAKKVLKGGEGLGRAHRHMVLEESAKYQQLTVDPEKAQLLGTRQFSLIDIANAVGIQAHKIGDSSRVAYNSLEQSNQEHLDDDLDPILQTWEDELGEKTLTEQEKDNDTHYIEFNRKMLVRVNLQVRTARHAFERGFGLKTANQILRQENEPPIGPAGDTLLVPANHTVLDAQGLPIIRGQAAPEARGGSAPSGSAAVDRLLYEELALHEVERMTKRATNEAARRAKQGDAAYLAFLEELPAWSHQPQQLAPVLTAAASHIHQRLNEFTSAPYAAAALATNVAAAIATIRAEAFEIARQQLEFQE